MEITGEFLHSESELPAPTADIAELTVRLGVKGIQDRRLVQWLAWSEAAGILSLMADRGSVTLDDVMSRTVLSECGADVLLGILASLGLIHKRDGKYTLSELARQYLIAKSPYYFGDVLYAGCSKRLPNPFLRAPRMYFPIEKVVLSAYWWLAGFGTARMLRNQHGRNLAPNVVASRTGRFDGVKHLVDVAGGTGTFAIPFAQRYPDAHVTLTDMPRSVKEIKRYLARHGLEGRIRVVGMDMFRTPWPIAACDGIFLGNILHTYADDGCSLLLQEAARHLAPDGRIWVHEVLWNDNKDGPLTTALWNGTLRRFTEGRQRTGAEIIALLGRSGFVDAQITATAGGFSLVEARARRA
jgi:SAM-dependent methyltransferase